jgi:uncharacterized membrane protein
MVITLNLADYQIQVHRTWRIAKTKCLKMPDLYYLGHGWLSSPTTLYLMECQVQVPWVWHVSQTHVTLELTDYQVQLL